MKVIFEYYTLKPLPLKERTILPFHIVAHLVLYCCCQCTTVSVLYGSGADWQIWQWKNKALFFFLITLPKFYTNNWWFSKAIILDWLLCTVVLEVDTSEKSLETKLYFRRFLLGLWCFHSFALHILSVHHFCLISARISVCTFLTWQVFVLKLSCLEKSLSKHSYQLLQFLVGYGSNYRMMVTN